MATVCRPAFAVPPHKLDQQEYLAFVAHRLRHQPNLPGILRILRNTTVETRHLALPWPELTTRPSIGQRMDRYLQEGVRLAARVGKDALDQARIRPDQVGCLVVVSCTGHALPGIDAHLVGELELPQTVRRLPVMQMGCAGGAYALVRAADFTRAYPGHNVLVVALELSSLSYQPPSTSVSALVSQALFGDACAATVVRPGDQRGLQLGTSWEYLLPDSLPDMVYRLDDDGFHFDTRPSVTACVQRTCASLRSWLRDTGGEPEFLIAHTGGPKIMDTLRDSLGCDERLLLHSRANLRENGNTASVAVLDVLARTFDEPPTTGAEGLLIAFGPGVTTIAMRCQWN